MSEENVELIREGWEAWLSGNLDALLEICDPDVVWDISHFREWPESEYRGIEGVRQFLTEWLEVWGDYEVGVDEVLPAPDGRVVSLFWQRGRGHQSGLAMEAQWAMIATVRDGKITRFDNYDDRAEALEAAGLSEQVLSEENVELVRRLYEAYDRADIERMLALADPPPDFEFVPSGVLIPDLSRVQRGPEGLRRLVELFFGEFDAIQLEVHELIDAGDQVYSAFTLQGRGKQSGVETTFDGWLVWTVRDGRIARLLGFTEREPALEAAGLSEQAMSEENVEIVRRFYRDSELNLVKTMADDEAMARYEASMLPFVHPSFEVVADPNFAGLGDPGTAAPSGIEAFRAIWREWLLPWESFWVRLEDLVSLPDSRVLALVENHGRPKASDVELSLRSGVIWTLTEGQVSRLEHFLDRDQALQAAGLSE